ncbi:MAG: AAA family ATPase [Pirellulales bacterium]|nr:AAA family ATPase [Pirellulales bacterium]
MMDNELKKQLDHNDTRCPKWQCDVTRLMERQAFDSPQWLHFRHLADQPTVVQLHARTMGGELQLRLEMSQSNVASITCCLGSKDVSRLPKDRRDVLFAELSSRRYLFFQPTTTLPPSESSLSWPQVQDQIAKGKDDDVWRNALSWQCEGKPPEAFQDIVGSIQRALPEIAVRPPRRTRDQQPKVVVTYDEVGHEEERHEYDISEAGAGLRTCIRVITSVALSESTILLLDEPDSHLHSSVQRELAGFLESQASDTRQIIVATHAPDMIDAFPLESLLWIDRSKTEARRCDDVAKTMVELGAMSHAQAIELVKADCLLFFEARPDRKVFESLIKQCGFDILLRSTQVAELKGCGNTKHLSAFATIASELADGRRIRIAAIRDNDFEAPEEEKDPHDAVLIVKLPCKEIENLLLLQPKSLADAAKNAAELRRESTHEECSAPTCEEIERMIDEVSSLEEIKEKVQCNWVANRLGRTRDGGELKKWQKEFKTRWTDAAFRRRYGPGKAILAGVKKRLQDERKISLPAPFRFYQPDAELMEIFQKISDHFHEGS